MGCIFKMTVSSRKLLLIMIDMLIVSLVIITAQGFTLSKLTITFLLVTQVIHYSSSYFFGLYRKVWAYASIKEFLSIGKAATVTMFGVGILNIAWFHQLSFQEWFFAWSIYTILLSGSRLSWRIFTEMKYAKRATVGKRVMIIGAGQVGRMIARQMIENPDVHLQPVLFVDDDPSKQRLELYNIQVLNGIEQIDLYAKRYAIEMIILAIPSLAKLEQDEVLKKCISTGIQTKIVPCIEELMMDTFHVNQIKEVRIEDLLGRKEVTLDLQKIATKLIGKTVLVTGAGGSIGSEICRQVLWCKPHRLILVGHGENSIYMIERELQKMKLAETEIIPIIASIQNRERIFEIVEQYKPDVIYHAAAYKHVPLMEANPEEAVQNNIFGTQAIAEAAHRFQVRYFVMVSSDKAVNPTNVMGATKRIAEMVIQNLARTSDTTFVAVRFGNVLGSRGSVVPLFQEQIKVGGPITITDPEMTRYFMTIPEASRLVIQAGALAVGGEVFVLNMGSPIKIVDLAKKMIRLSGFAEEEIPIQYSGIRPGEKLFEELLDEEEIQHANVYANISIGKATVIPEKELQQLLFQLQHLEGIPLKRLLLQHTNRKKEVKKKTIKITS